MGTINRAAPPEQGSEATALIASVADPKTFRSGRDFSACIGLVQAQLEQRQGRVRPAWILEPSATGLCEPDLHVFAKLFEDRLEKGS